LRRCTRDPAGEERHDHADGIERALGGVGRERFVYSDRPGRWHTAVDIGTRIFKGFVLGHLDGRPVTAPFDGVLRGLVRNSTSGPAGVKLLEIDARGRGAKWTGINERGRAIAQATMEAIHLTASRPELAGGQSAPFLV